MQFKKIE